jgi:translocation and assembly module TamB
MLQRLRQFVSNIRLKRVLLLGALTSFVAMLAFVALIAALPSILSTSAGQTYLRKALSTTLKRDVAWSQLALSWSEGLALKGLVLGKTQGDVACSLSI